MRKVIWTSEKKEQTIKKLTEYFEKYGIGESIQQSDSAQEEALDLVTHIADVILIEGEGLIYID